jgi:hypothetical protein
VSRANGTPIGAQHGAIGSMTTAAWQRGRRTGFGEGLVVGFLGAFIIFALRFFS